MKREIIFRGKTEQGEWLYGYYMYNGKHLIVDTTKGALGFGKEVISETVGQFTGLTDKNGKKIFEGDILQFIENPKFKEEVSFDDGAFGFYYKRTDSVIAFSDNEHGEDTEEYEVIGNVHDNKELLGENK